MLLYTGEIDCVLDCPSLFLGVPGTVSNIEVTVTRDSVTVSWTAADPNGVEITEYLISIVLEGREVFSTTNTTTTVKIMRSDIQESKDDTAEYAVTVTARNGLGEGAPANKAFTLPAGGYEQHVCVCV